MRSVILALLLILGVILLSAGTAVATAFAPEKLNPIYFNFYLANTEARFVRGVNQDFVSRSSVNNFAVGGRRGSTALLLEYGLFSEASGNATLSVATSRTEYMLWWKEHLYGFGIGDVFSTVGLGGYKEDVRTTLYGATTTDLGQSSAIAGAGLGIGTLIFRYISVSVEGRLVAGSNFDPNPTPGLLLRAGLEF